MFRDELKDTQLRFKRCGLIYMRPFMGFNLPARLFGLGIAQLVAPVVCAVADQVADDAL